MTLVPLKIYLLPPLLFIGEGIWNGITALFGIKKNSNP
jgi:hypothetical protein